MAFAISSGIPPQNGLYCAIIAGFLCSAFGGTKCQVSGPTGAFVVVVAGIYSSFGPTGLFACTIMAGAIMLALGASGLGSTVKFIPRPVIVGFTNGIALLIASTQIKDFFGLKIDKVPSIFVPRLIAFAHAANTILPTTTFLAAGSLVILILVARFLKKIPGAIIVLFGGTAIATLAGLSVETIQSRFGGIPSGLPRFAFPAIGMEDLTKLIGPAVTVAMLGAIESLMSALVADRMTKDKHNPNVELMAQGLANVITPMFGGIPATGAIARTATNIRSGARTPMAGMIHAGVLLIIILFASRLAGYIPLCVLASILLMVAYNMGEWKEIPQILRLTKADIAVWFVTFMLTVFADLTVAVEAGMILAALLYIQKVTATTTVAEDTDEYVVEGERHSLQNKQIPAEVKIYRIHGPFLFGSTDKLVDIADNLEELPKVVIMRLRNMTAIDATGIQALEDLSRTLHQSGRTVIFCGMRKQPKDIMMRARFNEHVGDENICDSVDSALARAREVLGGSDSFDSLS